MSNEPDDLDALLADLAGDGKPDPVEVKEEVEVNDTPAVLDDNILDDLLVGEEKVPEPAPAKKPRGRPKGAAKAPAKVAEPKPVEVVLDIVPAVVEAKAPEKETVPEATESASEIVAEEPSTSDSPKLYGSKDIYILSESQILKGAVYRRGQKITFTYGDKFYTSQTDRNGFNWLDIVDDYQAQYAYFGRVLVEPDNWSGIPIGSTEGIDHPGLALAVSNFAKAEHERNGTPFN